MVFSQTSLKTQSVLKVVKLDRLKSEKSHQVNGSTGVVQRIDGYSSTAQSSPVATTSYTEVSLKTEPLYDSTMFNESDFEFFQELDPLCCDPAKEEAVQTIDSFKQTEEKALNIDTPHMPFSPPEWEQFDVNSPLPQAGFYNITPVGPLSPAEKFRQFDSHMFSFSDVDKNSNLQSQEKFLDSLPLVIGDLTSEPAADMSSWQAAAEPVNWAITSDTQYDLIYTSTPNAEHFINADDSLDLKIGSVTPGEVEVINLIGSEFVMNNEQNFGAMHSSALPKRSEGLSVDVSAQAPAWPGDISTPIILNDVISLEKEKCTEILDPPQPWLTQNPSPETFTTLKTSPKVDYEPITPKSESHMESDNDDSKSTTTSRRRRHDSEDSDETYTPYSEQPPRKYKRRKPSVPIKDLILALESQPKARRGRPPKRRESTVSSVCSVDENSSSTSTHEYKYRELRDKNNEASKRSRMNRKLKEQQMELLAVELEEKNKRLRVEADILEEMTKKLKGELMSAILNR